MKKRILFLTIMSFLIISCTNNEAKQNKKNYSDDEINSILDDALKEVPIEVEDYEGDLSSLTLLDTIEQETSESLIKFNEGDVDQFVTVVSKDYVLENAPYTSNSSYIPTTDDAILVDENDNKIDLELVSSSNGKAIYKIPVSKFENEHGYHVKLINDNVKFLTKDDTIRQLTYYSLNVTELNKKHTVLKTSDRIKTFDIDNVDYFDVDAFGSYFIYKETFDIDENIIDETGMKFRLANLENEEDDEDTVYGKLISNQTNPNGGGYMVRYEPCQGKDLFTNLNINDSITIDQNNSSITLMGDEGEFGQDLGMAFLSHPDTQTTIKGILNNYNVSPKNYLSSVLDWAAKLHIAFSMKWDDSTSTFNWGATATLNFDPEDNVTISLKLVYKQTIRFKVSASASLDYWGFIPTGINYKIEVTEDDTKEVEFGIHIATNLSPYDEDKIKESIEDEVLNAFKNDSSVSSIFKGNGPVASSDGRSYPLFTIDCYYFWPLDIRFSVEFYWKCQLSLDISVRYTSHTQRVDLSIANSKGCDPHSESKAVNDKSVTINFLGTFHAEIGLRIALGIGIVGFYRFFHAEVFICAYGAVDARGFMIVGISWNDEISNTIGVCGGKFEISIGVKWGVDIALLFGGYNFEWPIVSVPLIGFAHEGAINNFTEEESIVELTDEDYQETGKYIDLDEYHLLGVSAFDSKTLAPTYLDMKHDESVKTKYGAFLNEATEKYFTFELISGEEYIELNDYKVKIKSIYGIEEFEAIIKVTVNDSLSTKAEVSEQLTKTIKIHFTNRLKQQIFIKDQDGNISSIGSYVIGANCKLPVPVAPRYKKFIGWKNIITGNVISYDETDETSRIYIPQSVGEVTFEYIFVDDFYWEVTWVDGFNNIIKVEEVKDGESANAPEESIRDRYMTCSLPGFEYVFIGYDKDYSAIYQNTVIRAQYTLRRAQ